jgi:hypothetical protein
MIRAWSDWDNLPTGFAAPLTNMSSEDAAAPAIVAAAATPLIQIQLTTFSEDNIELWLSEQENIWRLNNVTKASSKFAVVCGKLPRSIMDVFGQEIGAIGLGPDPFVELSKFLIRHFGRNKWNSYFQLLSLPIAVENVKPFTVLSQLKSLLPFGADVNSEMFMAMFLMRLPESTREAVGSAGHVTVNAMCAHAENMYSFRGGFPSTTVAAAVQQRSRSPAKTDKKKGEKQGKTRTIRPTNVNFFDFKNPKNGSCKFHNFYGANAEKCYSPCNAAGN